MPLSTRARFICAAIAPPTLGVIFVPVFRAIQQIGFPQGSLEGIDLTRFAERDTLVLRLCGAGLLACALGLSVRARTWKVGSGVFVVAVTSSAATLIGVFAALLAG